MEIEFTVLKMYRDGRSKRGIARDLRMGRHTIDRIVGPYAEELRTVDCDDVRIREMAYSAELRYDSSGRKSRKMTDAVRSSIEGCLRKNRSNRAAGMYKQRQDCTDIWHKVVDEGHDISYSSVNRYVKSLIPKASVSPKTAYLRISYAPGDICEFDWGEIQVNILGRKRKVYMAVFTLAYSNGRYAYLFSRQDMLAFMESHRDFFAEVGGVPKKMVYDNMRVAVASFTGDKQPTEALLGMMDFYGFAHRFCNARSGWEKGHVEKSVGYVRKRAFTADTDFASLDAAQEHLSRKCAEINGEDGSLSTVGKVARLKEDLQALAPCDRKIGCFEMVDRKVDSSSTVVVGSTHYSVPDSLIGETLSVKLYSDRICVYKGREKVAAHERDYRKGEWHVKLEHYLATLSRKPGAIGHCEAFRQAPKDLQGIFERHFANDGKAFIGMLSFMQAQGFAYGDLTRAYRECKARGARRVSADMLQCTMLANADPQRKPVGEMSRVKGDVACAIAIDKAAESTLDDLTGLLYTRTTGMNKLNTGYGR